MNRLFQGNHGLVDQARALYVLIRQQDKATRQFLSEQLDLPATSLNRALEKQLRLGLIEEYDLAESTGGRRPGLYRIVERAYFLLGLDLSGAASRLVLTDLKLQVLAELDLPGLSLLQQNGLVETICSMIRQVADNQGVPLDRILGLGIGLPDPTTLTDPAETLKTELESSLDLSVCLLRGADAALYAGLWQQLDLADKTFLYLSAGQTIRFGLAVGGQMQGANLLTDSIGRYLTALPDKSGAHPIEYAAAMPALIRRFQKSKDDSALSWSDFCLAVAAGKRKACSILTDAAYAMAVLIQNIALLTGGDRILLGGSALYDLPAYETAIREQLSLLASQGFTVPTCLDNPHGRGILAVGAAARILEYNLGLGEDAS